MSGWPLVTLDQCAEIVSGATPDTSDSSYWNGDICWATPKDLSELEGPFISDTPRRITRRGLDSCAASILPPGSVLFSSRAPIGYVAINRVPMATNQGFKSFIPNRACLDPKYLYHWLRKSRHYLESLGNGATFKEVSKAIVSRIEIPLPPLSDQWRISKVLDKVETLRAKRGAALAQLDTLTQSIFLDIFGDPATNPRRFEQSQLAALVRQDDTINYGVVQPGDDIPGGIPLIRVGDLLEGKVSKKDLKLILPAIEVSYKRSRLRGDEILVSCVGSIGVVALADESIKGFNIARAVARIPLAEATDRVFLANYLRTDFAQRYFQSELRTVSQPTLNIKQICETPVLLPPISLQRRFARRVAAVEELRATGHDSAVKLDLLLATLQHRAFRGKL
jgi:type I restriction enzyme S subunit